MTLSIMARRVRRVRWFIQLLLLPTLPLLLFVIFAFAFFATVQDVIVGSTFFPAKATHVPTFYVPKHRYPKYMQILLLISLGTLFGGIHCAGWHLHFPTHTEQTFWRVASVAVTIFPIAAPPFVLVFIVAALTVIIVPVIAVLIASLIFILIFSLISYNLRLD